MFLQEWHSENDILADVPDQEGDHSDQGDHSFFDHSGQPLEDSPSDQVGRAASINQVGHWSAGDASWLKITAEVRL